MMTTFLLELGLVMVGVIVGISMRPGLATEKVPSVMCPGTYLAKVKGSETRELTFVEVRWFSEAGEYKETGLFGVIPGSADMFYMANFELIAMLHPHVVSPHCFKELTLPEEGMVNHMVPGDYEHN